MKKSFLILLGILVLVSGSGLLYPIEMGVIGGTINNPVHSCYGLSAGSGFLIPMMQLEVEYVKIHEAVFPELGNTLTGGIKFRPKIGSFLPYVVVGGGIEFDKLGLKFSDYLKFTFLGGGVQFKFAGVLSVRGDIRLFNYSGFNRTRLSAGIMLHI